VNKFLRTAPTRRLLATIAGVVLAIVAGTAIALAAQGSGPVPQHKALPAAIRAALAAPQVPGISADVSFTNHLIAASEIQGTDPLLSGGQGHVWVSGDGRFRLELYGDNGDPAVVVTQSSWWISDPTTSNVYEGSLPAGTAGPDKQAAGHPGALPTDSQIQTELSHLAQHLTISGAVPSDVGGQPTYTVTMSPKRAGGLLGKLQLAWDAARGVPLRLAVYARGDSNPVLELTATGVTYGPVDRSVFTTIRPPSGYNVVHVATPTGNAANDQASRGKAAKGKKPKHAQVTGVKAVASHLGFPLAAPSGVAGLTRQSVALLDMGGHPAALLTYGSGLGGVAVIEQAASASSARRINLTSGSGDHARGVSLPTVSVNGTTGQELDTALGTLIRFTRNGVTYTVIGSVAPGKARAAARGL
jgi:outer membrane lipoprotein-sorting protein